LFDGPFLHAEKGGRKLVLRYRAMHRELNFETLTIKDWIEE
jgi:hypothetical protein